MIFVDFVFTVSNLRFGEVICEDLGSCLKVCHVFLLGFVKKKNLNSKWGKKLLVEKVEIRKGRV